MYRMTPAEYPCVGAFPLREANRAIRWERGRFARKRYERWRAANPIHVIDGILGEIEEMNLRRVRRVPAAWQLRLASLAASLPPPVQSDPAELRAGISPNRLMEALFGIQDQLLDLRVGPFRRWVRQQEDEEEET
jgi:hypothetical protein